MGFFEQLKISRKPFQFIVCRRMPSGKQLLNTNIKVSLEDYKITESAKNGFDLTVKINLKQWRDYGTKKVNIVIAEKAEASVEPARETVNSPTPPAAQTYTVVKGDCLWNIAKRFYGSGSKYTVFTMPIERYWWQPKSDLSGSGSNDPGSIMEDRMNIELLIEDEIRHKCVSASSRGRD